MLSTSTRFLIGLLFVSVGSAGAQIPDARWSPWLGCWQSADVVSATKCVIPTTRSTAVDVVTVVNGVIESRERIDADGQQHPIDRAGCRGTETASWSPTGHRLYRRAELTCLGTLNGTSTTLMAISPTGEWLNVEGMRAGAGSLERLDRFRDIGLPSNVPKEIRTAITRQQLAVATARAAAAAPITESDVLEATQSVDPGVVRSWLAVSGAGPGITELASPPRQQQVVVRETVTTVAPCAGCYAPNAYSDYNGYVTYPYSPYSMWTPSPWAWGYSAPLIIVHGMNRGRPQVIHGLRPIPGRPQGFTPKGQTPPSHNPPPPVRPPMRPRP